MLLRLALLLLLLLISSCGTSEPAGELAVKFDVDCTTLTDSLVTFTNVSENAIGFEWDLGNGTRSSERDAVARYSSPGEYTVTLIAWNADGEEKTFKRSVHIYPSIPSAKTLDLRFVEQKTPYWCWAAASEMLMSFNGGEVPQCRILERYYGADCCGDPDRCRALGSMRQIQDILFTLGDLDSEHQYAPLTLAQIREEIAQGRPVIAFYLYSAIGHVVVMYGYDQEDNIYCFDPASGPFVVPYSRIMRLGTGADYVEWVETIRCIRKTGRK